MKLYYAPGTCALSPHIVLCEAGFSFDLVKVDLKTKKTQDGKDFNTISEKGYVPLLELDQGEYLSEGPAIVQYLADQKPNANLIPKAGTLERARVNEWLNFISTELHKRFSALFFPINAEATEFFRKKLGERLDYVNKKIEGKQYLMGDTFTVADAYLFTVLRWTKPVELDLTRWPNLVEYQKRVGARPKVKEALKGQGLA